MPGLAELRTVRTRLERAALHGAMRLPAPVRRRLAGPPVVLDGQELADDVQLMLRLQRLSRTPGPHEGSPAKGRALLARTVASTRGEHPIGSTRDLRVGNRPARLYVPRGVSEPGPLLVHVHGGGFFCGDLASHDGWCRVLAERSGARVLAVTYRMGPEHAFPAAHDDAVAAYAWALEHREELGATDLGVVGDSAGGNLAAHVALEAARRGWPCVLQVLVYPMADFHHATRSADLFGEGFYLTREFMAVAHERYGAGADDDPRLNLVRVDLAPVAASLAPAYVVNAGFDPLRDEGEAYAERLRAAGVTVTTRRFDGLIHGMLQLDGTGWTAPAALTEIGDTVRSLLPAR